jgi:hypothetical protein
MGAREKRRIITSDETPTDENHLVGGQRRLEPLARATTDEIHRERRLAALATRQDGLVTRPQLIALGFTRREIGRRIGSGSLIVLFRGVYAVGHRALTDRAWMRAAILTAGADVLLASSTAARAWDLVPHLTRPLHVLVPGRQPRSRPGLRVHTVRALDPRDRRVHDGLPLTSPARTLLDLAAVEPPDALARATREGRVRWNVGDTDLQAASVRAGIRHPGVRRLRAVVTTPDAAPTRSQLERAMLGLVDEAGYRARSSTAPTAATSSTSPGPSSASSSRSTAGTPTATDGRSRTTAHATPHVRLEVRSCCASPGGR